MKTFKFKITADFTRAADTELEAKAEAWEYLKALVSLQHKAITSVEEVE